MDTDVQYVCVRCLNKHNWVEMDSFLLNGKVYSPSSRNGIPARDWKSICLYKFQSSCPGFPPNRCFSHCETPKPVGCLGSRVCSILHHSISWEGAGPVGTLCSLHMFSVSCFSQSTRRRSHRPLSMYYRHFLGQVDPSPPPGAPVPGWSASLTVACRTPSSWGRDGCRLYSVAWRQAAWPQINQGFTAQVGLPWAGESLHIWRSEHLDGHTHGWCRHQLGLGYGVIPFLPHPFIFFLQF